MRLKRCKRCGRDFQAAKTWNYFCPECAAEEKRETVIRPRTCRQCGTVFPGGPRAWYCPECRQERRRAGDRESKRRGAARRPIGSKDVCVRCGKEYVVSSGRQMYCPDCADAAVREKERARKADYYRENQDKFSARKRELARDAKVCAVCGQTFSGRGSSVTCSDACAGKYRHMQQLAADVKRGRRKPPE